MKLYPLPYLLKKVLCFLLSMAAIKANAQLKANFTASSQEGCSPLLVQFTDVSAGTPNQWFWDLGNGAISTEQNPGAIYISPGTYTIKLRIMNAAGTEDSIVKTDFISVHANPSVLFKANPLEGCAPLDVQFNDMSSAGAGSITNWIWDFGDGINSSTQNPLHTYNISDTFDVILTVINSFGCRQTLQSKSLIKVNGIVKADFNYNYTDVCKPPATVNFFNTSFPEPLTYQWNFGDGTGNTQKDPVHVYNTSGTFNVMLTARNENNCVNTSTQIISIGSAKADFVYTNTCVNEPVFFKDTSTPKPIAESWDFGDGTTGSGDQVNHVYSNSGTFNVTLTADFGACTDVLKKNIKITPKPTASFTATGNRLSCTYPVTIQFNNTTTDALNYQWIFGDGSKSNAVNPSHTYDKAGSFSVTLIAYNSTGCPDTLIRNNFIQLGPPKITGIENIPVEACAPQTITFRALVNSPDAITEYQWLFGDGTSSTDSVPIHVYNDVGTYTVTVIVTTQQGCTDTLTVINAVSLGKKPDAHFIADPLNACAQETIQFTDSSNGIITDWLWDFGDGGTSILQSPGHNYNDTGYFTITLIVSEYGCYDTITKIDYVYIKPPVAKFIYDFKCSDPFKVSFTDSSIAPETWHWDFGDGLSSDSQNTSHTYATSGNYAVTLTVTNGNCSNVKTDTINIINEHPSFDYEPLLTNYCKHDSVEFFVTKYQPENIKAFYWDFGDGITTGFSINFDTVYHLYTSAGPYKPLLVVKDIHNCIDTVNKNIQLDIYGPTAAFSNNNGNCLINKVDFKDESYSDGLHAIATWIWDYGDSTKPDTLQAPPFSHAYTKTGSYTVSLKLIDNNGCADSVVNVNAIEIAQPIAQFDVLDSLSCSASSVQFIDSSTGISMSYNWSFGDGGTSSNPEPLHNYANEGVYDVKLIVADKYGCTDSIFKPAYVTIANPVASFFLPDSLFLCPPAKVEPNNTSKNSTVLLWDFGDGNTSSEIAPVHYYNSAGNYNLILIAKGYGTCYDTIIKPLVLRGPQANLLYTPFTGCNPLDINFSATAKNTIQFIWDYGDGVTKITSDTSEKYTYLKPGRYIPQLVVVDSGGCRVSVVNHDTIVVFGVDTKFVTQRGLHICDSALINFTDSSLALYDTVISYHWDFGDGDTAFTKNTVHYYSQSNTYNPFLTVTTQKGCSATYQAPLNIIVDSIPKIVAFVPDSACVFSPVDLFANSVNTFTGSLDWKWSFGNGDTAHNQEPSYTYSSAGSYNIVVIANSLAGCSDTTNHLIRIDPLPVVNAGSDSMICLGQTIKLIPNGADKYTWLPDPSLSCTNCINPDAKPTNNTTYFVTGVNIYGCKAIDSVMVEVKQPANVILTAPDTLCEGNTIKLQAAGAELYSWMPASQVSVDTGAQTSSIPHETTTFTVIGTDTKKCFADTSAITVHVFPYPTIQLTDSIITIEVGSSYKINAIGSADITAWQWAPLTGLSCADCAQPVAQPRVTTTYKVDAKNIAGCNTEESITITVLCKNQNLFIPNTFSPNGDGMNDFFFPRGKGLFTVKSFRVLSRWGNIVFESFDFPPNQQTYGWNGMYKGKMLQPDVYVYVIEVVCDNGIAITTKGNVTLLR